MKNKFKRLLTVLLIFLFFSSIGTAQSIKRQSIGSYGSGGFIEGAFISQTIGQPFFTSGHSDHVISISPGFQQPVTYRSKKAKVIPVLSGLTIFPNPASDYFTIETSEMLESAVLKITDLNGRVILEDKLTRLQSHTINSSHLQNGMYFITVGSGNNSQEQISKIIISK